MDATWTVPKNIRQIGEAHAHYAVYIEDYVSTYIKQVVRLSDGGIRQGALVGKVYPEGEKTLFVIQGIVTDKELYRSGEQLFSQDGREALQEQCGQYFAELDIIGEVIFGSEKEDMDIVARRGMLSENAAARKLLLHVDIADGAQEFYISSQGAVETVGSYYIYYDRNEAMQNYLIAYNEETRRKVEEVHDIICGQARAVLGEFRAPRVRVKKDTLLICVTCALLICVSLLGIINMNQYQKMCEMQESFNSVLANLRFGDGGAVPASSDAALRDRADGNHAPDITPEDGIAAEGGQDGLFDGLPIYVSDVTLENAAANAPGQTVDGNDVVNVPGQTADGSDASGAPGQTVDGNAAANVPGQTADGNDVSGAPGQTADGNATANVPGQTADGNDVSGAPDQTADGSDVVNAPGQTADGSDASGVPGQTADGSDVVNMAGQNTAENNAEAAGLHTDGDTAVDGQADGAGVSTDGTDAQQNNNGDGTLAAGGASETGAYREYTIQKGDTLTSISILFYQNKNMIGQICELNGIRNADNIVAGQKILLP